MADIHINHTRTEGTILTGSRKGDGVYEIVKDHTFRSSRHVSGLYIRGSRNKESSWRINAAATALREAGHTVRVEIDDEETRSFAEIEAEAEARADERAERAADRAGRALSSADARRATADQISKRFEFGQPILVGHHSEGKARRDAARIDSHMRKSFEERDRAGYWANRADAAESYAAHRKDPFVTLRRLERLRADLRALERQQAESAERGWEPGERTTRRVRELTEEIAGWEELVERAVADGVKVWGPDDFAPGDYVRYTNSYFQVARVNPKSLSIAWNLRLAPKQVMTLEDATLGDGEVWTHIADYTKVQWRCPEAAMAAWLADGKVPGRKLAGEASEAAPAATVREAQAAAKKVKPKRRADPKIPKKIRVECRWNSTEATLTWLNGRGQPHKDHPAVTLTAPEGTKYIDSVWSKVLGVQIGEVLAAAGYAHGRGGWSGGPGSGLTGSVVPIPKQKPEVADKQPAPGPAIEERPAGEPPVAEVGEGQVPVDVPPVAPVTEAPTSTPEGVAAEEKSPLTRDSSGSTRNHAGPSGVVHSDYPLQAAPLKESAMTATKTPTAAAAPAKAPTKKATKPTKVREAAAVEAKVKADTQKVIPIDRIDRDPAQPREHFDTEKLAELAGSMRELGQLQPISVRYDTGTRRYTIIMGERRWRAAKAAGLTEMTAVVQHNAVAGSRELLARQVAENVGRADMTAMEEAKSFKALENSGYTVEEIGRMCGKSPAYVGWRIDLLKLCGSAQEALAKGHLGLNLAWYAAQLSQANQVRFLSKYSQGAFNSDRDAEAFVKACRAEEQQREAQGSFFVLADETESKKGDTQEALYGPSEASNEERERVASERAALTKKIERLSTAGEILAELATADPEELALLLAGAAGGVAVHTKRMEHLRKLTGQAISNLTKAQAIASVRAGAIEINPDAVADAA
ncbi:ParB/RepB/Spo0J family partition protein [Streptomyces microflavus]|uniref:ParB/RepB/Spo0J family partition protein n=1 Tax=Streptomyces microflavus TaxID=1919 RepID=UPI003667C949